MMTDREILEEIVARNGRLQRAAGGVDDKNAFALKVVKIRRMQDRGLLVILRETPDYRNADLSKTVAIHVKILDLGRRVLAQ